MARKNKSKRGKSSRKKENFSSRILSVLRKNHDKPLNYKQISAKIGANDPSARNQVLKNISKLVDKSKIDPVGRGKYQIADNPEYVEGVLDMTTTGVGYVIVEELEKDIFIPHKKLNHALHGDRVEVFIFGDSKKKKIEGEIVKILHRRTTVFVGILRLQPTFGFVEMNNPKMYTDIFIPRNKVKRAKDGEVVQVEIEKWPVKADSPEGKITKVLGEPGKHETEMQAILASSGLSNSDFSREVEDYVNNLDTSIRESEIKKRKDFRKELTFTIDPHDAKDFDDALSFKKLENGNYEIGIHIADVSHYVKPDSILDEEAFERGNSIYLVDRTIPMLPEALSNMACSLRPEEDKYTFSAIFEIDEKAKIVNQWFGKTAIRSDARFSYAEAQHIIETQENQIPQEIAMSGKAYEAPQKIAEAILKMNDLAKILRSNRMQHGAISFDTTEVKFHLNQENEPTGIYFQTQKEANHLIEEFMLLTNRKVAEFINKKEKKKTFIYRCHDKPDDEKLASLRTFVGQFGYDLNLKDRKSTIKSLNGLLKKSSGTKEENLISTLTIRSMSKAYYSTVNIGHYGLAFDDYSHFTSPIRRYSDIMAHRLLTHYLAGNPSAPQEKFEEKCKHCSETERFAIDAERDSVKYMQVKFMQQYKNETFLGVISGVTDFGIFVEIIENKCEGMVRLRDIKEDHFDYIEKEYAIIGRHTGKKYQLGDEVYVKVKNTDLVKRNLDFDLIGEK